MGIKNLKIVRFDLGDKVYGNYVGDNVVSFHRYYSSPFIDFLRRWHLCGSFLHMLFPETNAQEDGIVKTTYNRALLSTHHSFFPIPTNSQIPVCPSRISTPCCLGTKARVPLIGNKWLRYHHDLVHQLQHTEVPRGR